MFTVACFPPPPTVFLPVFLPLLLPTFLSVFRPVFLLTFPVFFKVAFTFRFFSFLLLVPFFSRVLALTFLLVLGTASLLTTSFPRVFWFWSFVRDVMRIGRRRMIRRWSVGAMVR